MENFLLGVFQDQLSKLIVGFRKDQVNANLLNGKGEIKDVSLNVDVINELMSNYQSYIELASVHVTKLSFNVTSFTNLKKAPIVISIDEVHVNLVEPMGFTKMRSFVESPTRLGGGAGGSGGGGGRGSSRGPYNLFDRIADNITLDVNRVYLTFQPMGKFKTRRVGLWTPPALKVCLSNLRYVSVDEFGEEGSPEAVWRHNSRERRGSREGRGSVKSIFIYKRLSLGCTVSLQPPKREADAAVLLRNAPVEIHIAFHKRLRDAAFLAVQADVSLQSVEVEIDSNTVPLVAHTLAGVQHCVGKDRSFEDPLLSESESARKELEANERVGQLDEEEEGEVEMAMGDGPAGNMGSIEVPTPPKGVLTPGISFASDASEDTIGSDEEDQRSVSNLEDIGEEAEEEDEGSSEEAEDLEDVVSTPTAAASVGGNKKGSMSAVSTPQRRQSGVKSKDDPVLILPGELCIHDGLSVSLSVHHCTVRAKYHSHTGGYIQCVVKGMIAELIWPKNSGEKGGYAQVSLSYLAIQERHGKSIRPILIGGIQHEQNGPVNTSAPPMPEVDGDVNFPLFENRSIREDPLGLRHSFPVQAIGIKSTIDFVENPGSSSHSKQMSVLHEVGMDKMEIVLDSDAWCRAARFLFNVDGGGFDPRWYTGDWTEHLTADMLLSPSEPLKLDDHLQPLPEIFLDENLMVSSELFNVTARMTQLELRLPAPVQKDVRSSDVIISMRETMFLVSSALPRTFLNGKLSGLVEDRNSARAASSSAHFPNDQSDICYSLAEREKDEEAVSSFRMQMTLRGLSVRIVPVIAFCNATEPQSLVAPTEITMIACLDGQPPPTPDSHLIKIAVIVSVLVHKLELNFDLEVMSSAMGTILYHTHLFMETYSLLMAPTTPATTTADQPRPQCQDVVTTPQREMKPNRGASRYKLYQRRILVQKQFVRSRETGGLTLVCCVHVPEFEFRLWRQNVPLRDRADVTSVVKVPSAAALEDDCEALVLLLKVRLKQLEIGLEGFEGHPSGTADNGRDDASSRRRRVVMKCCLSEFDVDICDFDALCDAHRKKRRTIESVSEKSVDEAGKAPKNEEEESASGAYEENLVTPCVELLALGSEKTRVRGRRLLQNEGGDTHGGRDISLRVEQQLEDCNHVSCACEVTTGGFIQLKVSELESLVTLIVESLLMPTGRCCRSYSFQNTEEEEKDASSQLGRGSSIFPDGSVGALFGSLFSALSLWTDSTEEADKSDETMEISPVHAKSVTKGMSDYNVDEALFRFFLRKMLVVFPDIKDKNDAALTQSEVPSFGLLILDSSLVTGYFDGNGNSASNDPIIKVQAGNGTNWTPFFQDQACGFHHIIKSRQSFHVTSARATEESGGDDEVLVPPFGVECYYHPESVRASAESCSLVMNDFNSMRRLYDSLATCGAEGLAFATNIPFLLSSLRQSEAARGGGPSTNEEGHASETLTEGPAGTLSNDGEEASPLSCACDEASLSVRAARSLFNRIKQSLAQYDHALRSAVTRKQKEVDTLRSLVFCKERQRIAAVALLSSDVSGWLRMGGTHQSGQRVATTTTMLRYWAVLRRSLLIVFAAPGKSKPADIIPLDGASLQTMAGGRRKTDVMRGFALVEINGRARFFVASTSSEYELWVRELSRAIESCASKPATRSQSVVDDDEVGNDENVADSSEERPRPTEEHDEIQPVPPEGSRPPDDVSTMTYEEQLEFVLKMSVEEQASPLRVEGNNGELGTENEPARTGEVSAATGDLVRKGTEDAPGEIDAIEEEGAVAETEDLTMPPDERVVPKEDSAGKSSVELDLARRSLPQSEHRAEDRTPEDTHLDPFAVAPHEGEGRSQQKGQQLRQRFSAMRATTKVKFGSAVRSARDNVRAAKDKQFAHKEHNEEIPSPAAHSSVDMETTSARSATDELSGDGSLLLGADEVQKQSDGSTLDPTRPGDKKALSQRMRFGGKMQSISVNAKVSKLSARVKSAVEHRSTDQSHGEGTGPKIEYAAVGDSSRPDIASETQTTSPVETKSDAEGIISDGEVYDLHAGIGEGAALNKQQIQEADSSHSVDLVEDIGIVAETVPLVTSADHSTVEPAASQKRGIRDRVSKIGAAAVKSVKLDSQALKKLNSGSFQNPAKPEGPRAQGDDDAGQQSIQNRPRSLLNRTFGSGMRRGSNHGNQQNVGVSQKEGAIKLKSIRVGSDHPPMKEDGYVPECVDMEQIGGKWVVQVSAEKAGMINDHIKSINPPDASNQLPSLQKMVVLPDQNGSRKIDPYVPQPPVTMNGTADPADAESQKTAELARPKDFLSSSTAPEVESGCVGGNPTQEAAEICQQVEATSTKSDESVKDSIAASPWNAVSTRPQHALDWVFHIRAICTDSRGGEHDPPPVIDSTRSLPDVLALHAAVSESVGSVCHENMQALPDVGGDGGNGGKSLWFSSEFGHSPLDHIRLTGQLLFGMLESSSQIHESESVRKYQCEILAEFLSSTLECPLPLQARDAIVQFLDIATFVDGSPCDDGPSFDYGSMTVERVQRELPSPLSESVLSLSASCESELARAESRGILAKKLASSLSSTSFAQAAQPSQGLPQPLLPTSVSDTLHSAMHKALITVMAERDEAHAQLIAASVLHVHEMEQERKKVDRLSKKLEVAEKLADGAGGPSFFLGQDETREKEKDSLRKYEKEMMQNTDAELLALCQQLASEISARTSAALEIIRLKESRKIERDSELAERQELQNELKKYKELLAAEQRRSEEARRHALGWKQSFMEEQNSSSDAGSQSKS